MGDRHVTVNTDEIGDRSLLWNSIRLAMLLLMAWATHFRLPDSAKAVIATALGLHCVKRVARVSES